MKDKRNLERVSEHEQSCRRVYKKDLEDRLDNNV